MTTPSLPKTMRTLLQEDYHSNRIILIDSPLPAPTPDTDEHLIRIHAVAITNNELTWNANFPPPPQPNHTKLHVPCYDLSGTVITSPPSSPFQPGAEVWARSDYRFTGAASEFMMIEMKDLALKPKGLSWTEAASIPMSAETAFQALFVHGGLVAEAGTGGKGKRVFVTGASGAVGSWVVMLGAWCGADVVGSCSGANMEFVESLRAKEVLDYRETKASAWAGGEGKKVDLVIDCVGGSALEEAWWSLKDGGTIISVYQPPAQKRPEGYQNEGVKEAFFVMEANGEQLGKVAKLIDDGNFKAVVDSVWDLAKFEEAFQRSVSGKTRGKVVLDLGA